MTTPVTFLHSPFKKVHHLYSHFIICSLFLGVSCTHVQAKTDFTAIASAKKLPKQITDKMSELKVKPHHISIIVQKVTPANAAKQKNPALLAHLPNKSRLPASTLKLFTTFSALDALGENFHWKTRVYHTGTMKNGVLNGDLIIKGGADPKLVKEHIINLLEKVKAGGIHTVNGNIILDTSIFKLKPHNPSAFDGKPLRPYNAGASGLLVNFSALVLHFTPDEKTGLATMTYEPEIADIELPTNVPLLPKTGKKYPRCKNWRLDLQARFEGHHLVFDGNYNPRCNYGTWPVAHPDPDHFAKSVFKGNWLALGGKLTGDVKYGKLPNINKLVATQDSPSLFSVIKDINHYSNNVMTEQVFLSLPAYARQKGNTYARPANYAKAQQWFNGWWDKRFGSIKKLSRPKLTKASGLCHDCRITPMSMNALLHFAAHHPRFEYFKDSLSVVGKSGTIRNYRYRMPDSPAIEKAYMKTGTLDNVTSVAGYVDGQSGQRYSLVAIINRKNAALAKPVLDEIIDWTAHQ